MVSLKIYGNESPVMEATVVKELKFTNKMRRMTLSEVRKTRFTLKIAATP